MNQTNVVLIVDDDPNNVALLEDQLEDENYEIVVAHDGVEAWDYIQNNYNHLGVILLDRMMPNMNGIEVMKKINENTEISRIPVIMQTAASAREEVLEGIDLGVYYYLTKPFDRKLLLSLVHSAHTQYSSEQKMNEELRKHRNIPQLFKTCELQVQTLTQANDIAPFIANFYPDPGKVSLGVLELIINGIEHGNLDISYEDKTSLNLSGQWEQEINSRLELSKYKDRRVFISIARERNQITLHIKDEGKGFDWSSYMDFEPSRATDNHGRGIAVANNLCFDKIEYIGCGNEVQCTYFLKENEDDSVVKH